MKQLLTKTIIAFTLSTSTLTLAQDADQVMRNSVLLMEKSNWQKALDSLQPMIAKNATNGVKTYGAKFGVAYYYQGLCELKLAQEARKKGNKEEAAKLFAKAIDALKKCYAIKNTEEDIAKQSANNYRIKALMLQGNAEQAMGQFQAAIQSYQTFLLERNNIRDTFDAGDFNINLAICYWRVGNADAKAEQLFLRAITARYHRAKAKSVLTGLRAMIESYSDRNKQPALEAFMVQHRDSYTVPLIVAANSLPYLSKLTLEAAELGLLETVTTLTNTIPHTYANKLADHKLDTLLKLSEAVKEEIPYIDGLPIESYYLSEWKLVKKETLVAINDAQQLAICARAIAFEKNGYYRGSLGAYQFLLEDPNFKKSAHRGDYLYNASRLGLLSSDADLAYHYGHKYLTDHPDHKLAADLKKLLMVTFYFSGEYEKCIAIGEITPLNDEYYSFTLGASYYYLGQFAKAEELLKKITNKKGEYQAIADYLYASTLGKLQRWKESISLLDSYLASDPADKVYIPFAYYDKAFALYSMQKYAEAETVLAEFQGEFKKSIIKPQAHILLGNIYGLQKKRVRAETEYLTAISAAKDVGNQHAREEAYYLVISLLGQRTWDGLSNPRLLDTLPLLERFLKEKDAHQSPYYTQVVTASFDALELAKRKNEGYEMLEEAIFLYNQMPNTPGTESALKTYTIAKRKQEISDEEIIATLQKSKHLANTPYHAGLIVVAELDVLERSQRLSPKPERAKKIKKLYLDLIVEHDVEALDNFVLVKVAEFLKSNGGSDSQAKVRKYYQAVLQTGSKIKRPQALVGLATELAKSDSAADRSEALKRFKAILSDPFTLAKPKADAHYQLIEILNDQKNYPELTIQIKAYLLYPTSVKKNIRRVEMLLATSYDKQGLKDKAIGAYNAVWVNSFENLDQSAPAIDRITDLIWERNNPAKAGLQDGKSDKQLAYETAYKYVRRTNKHYNKLRPKMTEQGINAYERIKDKIDQYAGDREVKEF